MLESPLLWVAPGAVVKTFFVVLPLAEFEFEFPGGCLRFLGRPDDPLLSSGLAENDDVPGIASLFGVDEWALFAAEAEAAAAVFRELDDAGFSPSILPPLAVF